MITPLEGPKMYHMIRRSRPVAEVFITHGRQAVLAWMGQCASIAIYPSFESLKSIHGHKSESGLDDTSFEPQDISHMMRYVCDIMQDHAENAMVPTSIADALRQALAEVAPDHPALKGENPSYGVWAGQRETIDRLLAVEGEYQRLRANADEMAEILSDLLLEESQCECGTGEKLCIVCRARAAIARAKGE